MSIATREKTGAQILAQPAAGGILFPGWNDELPLSYSGIWENYTDMPCFPLDIVSSDNGAYGFGTQWQFFYARRALWYRAIRAMRRDPTINLCRLLSIAPALAAGWSYEANEDAPEGAKEWIEKEMEAWRLHLLWTGMLGLLDFGWQSYEKVYTYLDTDKKYHIKKLKPLLPDLTHIRVDPKNGEFLGIQQFQNFANIMENNIVDLDVKQCLLYYQDYEGTNWYGNSTMRVAELPHRLWITTNAAATNYDRKVAGAHWVVSYPIGNSPFNGVDTDNFIIAKNIIAQLEASGAVAIPTMLASYIDDLNAVGGEFASEKRDWRVELLSDNSSAGSHFDSRLKYIDTLKARAFGWPERSIQEGRYGTKAEAGEHGDLALTIVETRHKFFCQHTNQQTIDDLLRFNWGRSAAGTVYCMPKPLNDSVAEYLKQVYLKLLDLPSTEPVEVANIDFEAVKDRLGIPTVKKEEDTESPADSEDQLDLDELLEKINTQEYGTASVGV